MHSHKEQKERDMKFLTSKNFTGAIGVDVKECTNTHSTSHKT